MINFHEFLKSLKIAASGVKTAFWQEQTFRIQIFIGTLVMLSMFWLDLSQTEMAVLILTITTVLSLELINSQIERILDIVRPIVDPRVKTIKDLSASAVLVSVLGAVLIGVVILLPHILSLFP